MKCLAADAEALCRAVAPELGHGPFYVVLRSDPPPEYQSDEADGCTMRYLDLVLRPTLERLGRWQGRGPAMILGPKAIAATAGRRPRVARQRVFPACAMGVVLHELAHILDLGPDNSDPPARLLQKARSLLAVDANGASLPTNGPGAPIPWRWHEWEFIRTIIHLAYRAAMCGMDMSPELVFDASDCELSPTRRYAAALGDEPVQMAGLDFAAISATPPPAPFAELWEADVRAWVSSHVMTIEPAKALGASWRRNLIP